MCVRNREVEQWVWQKRGSVRCVCVTGGARECYPRNCVTHTHFTPCHFTDTLNPPKNITQIIHISNLNQFQPVKTNLYQLKPIFTDGLVKINFSQPILRQTWHQITVGDVNLNHDISSVFSRKFLMSYQTFESLLSLVIFIINNIKSRFKYQLVGVNVNHVISSVFSRKFLMSYQSFQSLLFFLLSLKYTVFQENVLCFKISVPNPKEPTTKIGKVSKIK